MTAEQAEKRPPPPSEPSSFRLIATLGIAGFFSGLILVSAFLYTRPIIEQNRMEALQEAIFQVLPGVTRFETLELRDGQLVEIGEEKEEAPPGDAPRQIYAGYNEQGGLVGFAISSEEPGYQDLIVALFGYDPEEEEVIGLEILESKETPGLGDKIMKDPEFKANFEALEVEPQIRVVPKGEKEKPNQIEAITGATISSKAVGRLVEKGLEEWRPHIAEYIGKKRVQ